MLRYLGCAVAAVALTAGMADAATGPEERGGSVSVRVGLAGRDPVGLEAFARAVSTPGSAQYGRFLTPEAARARFGATAGQVAAVRKWLGAAGMTVTAQGAHWIDARGSAGAVKKAFGGGVRTLALPAEVRGAVSGVARVGEVQRKGMREGASEARKARQGLADHSGGVSGEQTRIAKHENTASTMGDVHSTGAIGTKPAAAPGKSPTACSPTWGALNADPKLPPGYTTPEPLAVCGYTPAQLRAAYGVADSGLTGKGVTIAVIDAYGSPSMRADADRFAKAHGDAPFLDGQYTETITRDKWGHTTDGVCQSPSDWAGEEALDVETVHGMAPDAKVRYFGANSCADEDINAMLAQIVDTHAADMVSSSFGETMHRTSGDIDPALVKQATQVFQFAATEGIGFYVASGDCGNEAAGTGPSCDAQSARAQTDWPVSSPWVTAVGGTALAVGPGGRPLWTATMGDRRSVLSSNGKSWTPFPGAFYFGGGGGTSEDFQQPYYQHAAVPDALARTLGTGAAAPGPMRTVPDVAMDGDLMTAVLVGVTDATTHRYTEAPVGGTSAATPMFVGVQADGQQAQVADGGSALGFANPAVYRQANQATFTDVVEHPPGAPADISTVLDLGLDDQGKRRVRLFELGHDQGLPAAPGYDLATGLGSPRAGYLESFKR